MWLLVNFSNFICYNIKTWNSVFFLAFSMKLKKNTNYSFHIWNPRFRSTIYINIYIFFNKCVFKCHNSKKARPVDTVLCPNLFWLLMGQYSQNFFPMLWLFPRPGLIYGLNLGLSDLQASCCQGKNQIILLHCYRALGGV